MSFTDSNCENKLLPASSENIQQQQKQEEEQQSWNFDDVFETIGQCGSLQLFYYVLLAFTAFNVGTHGMAPIFTHKVPKEVVIINGTETLVDLTDPTNCQKYHSNDTSYNFTVTGPVIESVSTEFKLVCDQMQIQKSELAKTIFFAGQASASLIAGLIGDNLGRKLPVLIFGILVTLASLLASYTENYTIYLGCRFTLAFAITCSLNAYVLIMEITGTKYRQLAGTGIQCFFAFGQMTLSGLAYYIRTWRSLQIAMTVLNIPVILIYFIVPESPRYLLNKGKVDEVDAIVRKIAKSNNKKDNDVEKMSEDLIKNSNSGSDSKDDEETEVASFFDMFKRKSMAMVTLKTCFLWITVSLSFYGVSLNTDKMRGNIFINNIVSAAAELISCCTLAPYLADKYPYKKSLSACYGIGGICFLLCYIGENNGLNWKLATFIGFLAKFFIAAAFAIIYNFTAGLFPTVVRGNAVSLASSSARFGSMLIQVAKIVGIFLDGLIGWTSSIFLIFAALTILSVLVILTMPETFGKPMIQSYEDADKLYKNK